MRSKHLLFSLIVLSLLAACSSSQRKFHIIGNIADMPEQTVILEQLKDNDFKFIIDSTKAKNGRFELSGEDTEPGLYRLRFRDNKFILLSIDKGNVKLSGTWNSLENYTVAGSPASEHLQKFLLVFRENVNDFKTMNIVLDTLRARGNDSLLALAVKNYQEMNQHFTQIIENYADTTPYQPNAIFAAYVLNPASENVFLEAFSQSLGKRFPGTKMAREFTEYVRSVNLRSHHAEPKKAMPIEAGAMAPEIDLPSVDGNVIALSSLRGKYVLIDFWASWCGPCRAENPNVVAAYEKYKNKNFTVYGVSLDNNKEKWEKAIKDDGLTWTQVSDLKGWSCAAALTYGIQSIPSNVLIDPTGKIIARNMRGELLTDMLEKVFNTEAPAP